MVKNKLCIVSKYSPEREGGVEEVVRQHVGMLSKLEWESITVFYMTYNKNEKPNETDKNGTKIIYRPIWVPPLKLLDIIVYNFLVGFSAYFGKYDVVHSHAECGFGYSLFVLLLGKKAKWIHTYHGVWFRVISIHLAFKSSLVYRLILKLANFILSLYESVPGHLSDLVTVVSPNVKKDIIEYYNIRNNIVVLPNSFDKKFLEIGRVKSKEKSRKMLKLENSSYYILYIGRDIYTKGLDIALEILSTLSEITLPKKVKLLALANGSNIQIPPRLIENIVIMEYVPKNLMVHIYSSCDVFIFPSRYDSFGIVALEAIATGLPVIVSNRVGFIDFIGTTKIPVVTVEDITTWIKYVNAFLTNKKIVKKFVVHGEKDVLKKFSNNVIGEKLRKIYILLHSQN
ncbi:hypothetical protein A3L04_02670 [Thermococcus chitonophagus]|uniref:Glycosyltransferase n=1 Tax=Thermococcus chitonophagus TaxID=54262 RepID=A0A160VSB0_9EURY|nr:glycosyltransferase family 4 protein [Thermococcus chitonophagus]ASJ16059.1 hypothetical protein A3L04_02670 [Thermococcus chitonophagus]CUX77306.1 Glycosyltransferase [Thermococcus chitonophagus]